jgi:Tol biopolymer transport system component/DNA-binding winged helix-turn-helix (wHTH) protein
MQPTISRTRQYRFGAFELDMSVGELHRHNVRLPIQGQPLQVLEILLLSPKQLVSREQLREALWPEGTFVGFDDVLNHNICRLREALDDDVHEPRFVETIPRRGYRFIAPVEASDSETERPPQEPSPDAAAPSATETPSQPPPVPRPRWIPAVALMLFLLIAAGAFFFIRLRNRPSPSSRAEVQENLRVTPLTTLPGSEVSPSFSPDGSQVVFAWDGGNSSVTSPFNLYVKAIGSEKVDRLTHEPAEFIVPAWSPDGRTIAFARAGGSKEGVFSIPARGGPERKLADATFSDMLTLSWSPDNRQLLYNTTDGLRILTPENGEVRSLDTGRCEAFASAFSPDGKWIAFICRMNGTYYLDLLSTKGGPSKHLIRGEEWGRMAWTNDSQRIVSVGSGGLWEININGGEPRRLMFPTDARQPAIAARGDRLAYVTIQVTVNIWRADTRTGSSRSVFAPATVEQQNAHISPDGKRIAFESGRSGSKEIWVANVDGTDAVQLSNFHSRTGTPRWSPDGRTIVFDSRASDKAALYLVDPATALPRQISTNGMPADQPSWSADGKWIYFHSQSSEPAEHDALYRVPPQGGIPERVAQARGYNAQQSKDGRLLYFAAGASEDNIATIYVLNLATGEQRPLADMPKLGCGNDWVLGSKGIFFVANGISSGQQLGIDFFDFSSHRVTRKIPFDQPVPWWGGLSLAPDETWLTFSQADQANSDLMLVEGFR